MSIPNNGNHQHSICLGMWGADRDGRNQLRDDFLRRLYKT